MAKAKKMNRGFSGKQQHEAGPSNWVQYSSGHAIKGLMIAYCGKQLSGWRAGTKDEVICEECKVAITS